MFQPRRGIAVERSLDELSCALRAAEHLRALVGRGKLVLVVPVRGSRERGGGGRGGGGRGPAERRSLLSAVRAVDLTGLLGHGSQEILRVLMSGAQGQRPFLQTDLILITMITLACIYVEIIHHTPGFEIAYKLN